MSEEQAKSDDGLGLLQNGLRLRVMEGEILLDLVAPIRRLSTATVRGLAGSLLMEYAPEEFGAYFKPEAHGNRPPAYLFQPVLNQEMEGNSIPFRMVSWEPEACLLERFRDAAAFAEGWPFGESGACVEEITFTDIFGLQFSGGMTPQGPMTLLLATPLQFRYQKHTVRADRLTLAHLIIAAVQRLNSLSLAWGNGLQLDPAPFLLDAANISVLRNRLRQVNTARRSRTQGESIFLDGIVGKLMVSKPSSAIADLLSIGEILHLGRHTNVGCGQLKWVGSSQ